MAERPAVQLQLHVPGLSRRLHRGDAVGAPQRLRNWVDSWDVVGLVSAAATWVITLRALDAEADDAWSLAAFSTSGQTAGRAYAVHSAIGAVADFTAEDDANVDRWLNVSYDEQSGTAELQAAVTIWYRLIAT